MQIFKFYGLVIREAFRHSVDIAQAIIFIVIIVAGLVVARNPDLKPMIEAYTLGGWQVAAIILGSIVLLRLLLAPYWLWKAAHARVGSSPLTSVDYQFRVVSFTNRNNRAEKIIQIVFQLRNSSPVLSIQYEVEDIDVVVAGFRNDTPTFLNRGGIVGPNILADFDYAPIQLSKWIKPGTEGTASITYKYGIAGQMFTRRAKFTANIIIQKNNIRHLTIEDTESSI